MKKLNILTLLLILLNILAFGQEENKVVVFKGRKVPFSSQKILDLSYQNLNEVPIEASNTEVEILILDNNNIEKIPRSLGNLKNLKVLSIRNNQLKELSSGISFCTNLEQLYLSGNRNLAVLPNLSFCEKLAIVDVVDTKINEIPSWIEMLDSLFYFKYTERNY